MTRENNLLSALIFERAKVNWLIGQSETPEHLAWAAHELNGSTQSEIQDLLSEAGQEILREVA